MYSVLVLNAAFQPSYEANFKKAWRLIWLDKVDVVEEADGKPSVVRLKVFYKAPIRDAKWSKRGVLSRDNYTCAYCGNHITDRKNATVDHVVPKERFDNGRSASTWTNTVCACWPCNSKKKNRTPEEAGMKLKYMPKIPRARYTFRARGNVPEKWTKYVQI